MMDAERRACEKLVLDRMSPDFSKTYPQIKRVWEEILLAEHYLGFALAGTSPSFCTLLLHSNPCAAWEEGAQEMERRPTLQTGVQGASFRAQASNLQTVIE
jgi:hypothetical protein